MNHRSDLLLSTVFAMGMLLFQSPVFAAIEPPTQAERDSVAWKRYKIEVYANLTSVGQGGTINLYVASGDSELAATNPQYKIQIFRVGATDSMYSTITSSSFILAFQHLHNITGASLPARHYPGEPKPYDFRTGCSWPLAYALSVPSNWKSGFYYAKVSLVNDTSKYRRTPFVVKEDLAGSTSNILYKVPFNTYHAYNNWGGSNLYSDSDTNLVQYNDTVSFLRPMGGRSDQLERTDIGSFDLAERHFIKWAEGAGYVMEYCTNVDLWADTSHNFITSYKFIATSGHDEYWTFEERSDVEGSFIHNLSNGGGNAAFLSGNVCFWKVDYLNNRTRMHCGKFAGGSTQSSNYQWRSAAQGNNAEAKFIGVQYGGGDFFWTGNADSVRLPSHWLFNNTQLAYGNRFGRGFHEDAADTGIVGGELDRRYSGYSPANVEVISSRYLSGTDLAHFHEAGFYIDTLSNARVFGAGSIYWSRGLNGFDASDRTKFQTIMTNLMDHFSEKKFIGNIYFNTTWKNNVELDGNAYVLANKTLTLDNNMTLTIDANDTLFVNGILQVNSNITINGSGVLRVHPSGALKKNRGTIITFGGNVKFQLNASIANGWNMTGIPAGLPYYHKDSVYSTRTSSVFEYNAGYQPKDTLNSDRGWWVKFGSDTTHVYQGGFIDSMAMNAYNGWNMIGSISSPIDTGLIYTDPAGIWLHTIFKYSATSGYTPATTLYPGGGYWTKTSAAGKIILNLRSVVGGGGVPSPQSDSYDKFTVTDANGSTQNLYVRNALLAGTSDNIEMPPPPPDNSFDVRFSPEQFLESVTPDSQGVDLSIALNSVAYPVELSWVINPDNGLTYTGLPEGGGGLGRGNVLGGSKSMVIQNRTDGLIHLNVSNRKVQENLPTQFSLQQNYPNPFNPSTVISYDIPVNVFVTLKVYDVLGREVMTLVNGIVEAGYHQTVLKAANLASGMYFYLLQAGSYSSVKKLVVLK